MYIYKLTTEHWSLKCFGGDWAENQVAYIRFCKNMKTNCTFYYENA